MRFFCQKLAWWLQWTALQSNPRQCRLSRLTKHAPPVRVSQRTYFRLNVFFLADMSFPSSQGSVASESSPSDEDEFEETLVYGALQRNCNQATVLRALQERRQNFSFARFHDIEELIDAVSRIEDRERYLVPHYFAVSL